VDRYWTVNIAEFAECAAVISVDSLPVIDLSPGRGICPGGPCREVPLRSQRSQSPSFEWDNCTPQFLEYWLSISRSRLRPITAVTYARDVRLVTPLLDRIPSRIPQPLNQHIDCLVSGPPHRLGIERECVSFKRSGIHGDNSFGLFRHWAPPGKPKTRPVSPNLCRCSDWPMELGRRSAGGLLPTLLTGRQRLYRDARARQPSRPGSG
jgi:hypothetical protein